MAPAPALSKLKAKRLSLALEPVRDQLVAAVFVRIAALSRGEEAGDVQLRREIANGHELVPQMVRSLQIFESHRDRYPTLALFLPGLLSDLRIRPRAEDTAPVAKMPLCELAV